MVQQEENQITMQKKSFTQVKRQSDVTVVWETAPGTEEETLQRLKKSPVLYSSYQALNQNWRRRFLDFCQGKKSLPLTYDPFFKRIFHPDIHPDRLSRFVSSLLGMRVKIVRVLPTEDSILNGETLLIMDLLGELEDGSLVNIEIQKQGYAFPSQRISCYSADLLMRQYARVKGERGSAFTYRDIKKVYVIVIYETSPQIFHDIPDIYVHHGHTAFQTGLKIELLQEFCLVALDVFREFPYAEISRNEQTAWLSLLSMDQPDDIERLTAAYPWIEEICQEIAMLRQNPEEVLGMFSEALKILDQNTMKYMIEELQKEVDDTKALVAEKNDVIAEKNSMIAEKDDMIAEKDAEIAELKRQLTEHNRK